MEILIALLTAILSSVPAIAQEPIDNQIIREPKPTVAVKTAEQADSYYLGTFTLSRYYAPEVGQTKYYVNREHDISMNCGWSNEENCNVTANWHILTDEDIGTLYSCPPSIPLGTRIRLEFHRWTTYWVCHDRWGSIKGKRLDSYCWKGDQWVDNIRSWKGCYTGRATVWIEGNH